MPYDVEDFGSYNPSLEERYIDSGEAVNHEVEYIQRDLEPPSLGFYVFSGILLLSFLTLVILPFL